VAFRRKPGLVRRRLARLAWASLALVGLSGIAG
jgi:hypothetical protein